MRAATALLLLATACGGNAEDTDPNGSGSCNWPTERLSAIPVDDWPAGLAEALPFYQGLGGVYYADDCVDPGIEHEIMITRVPQEELRVITSPPPSGSDCGCALDPHYPGDASMKPVALIPSMDVFIGGTLDPGGPPGRAYDMSGALFAHGEDLALRVCATRHIDPAEESPYDDVWFFLRVLPDGSLDMSLLYGILGDAQPTSVCDLPTWTR